MSLSCWLSSPRGFPQTNSVKRPFFFFFFELLHLSALLFVPQSSHSHSADVQVSLSSNAPSDWLRPPSEATLVFFVTFPMKWKTIISLFMPVLFPRKPDCVTRRKSGCIAAPSFTGGRVLLWSSLCRPPCTHTPTQTGFQTHTYTDINVR